jgi:cytochrome c oxidase subunit III
LATNTAAKLHVASVKGLHHQFADLEQQRESATLGMWIFLVTEIMFFGGMFTAYMIYRISYPLAWHSGSQRMDFWIGTINTLVLICSSLTMVLAVHAAKTNQRKATTLFLIVTLLFGLAFLGLKGIEYYSHFVDHEVPGFGFHVDSPDANHVQMFFVLYFFMTGFHALHMVVGVGVVSFIAYFAWKGHYTSEYHNPVENVGLYWHFVDIIWIFLYPLLYLVGRTHGPTQL